MILNVYPTSPVLLAVFVPTMSVTDIRQTDNVQTIAPFFGKRAIKNPPNMSFISSVTIENAHTKILIIPTVEEF